MGNCYPSQHVLLTNSTMQMSVDKLQLPCMFCNKQFTPQQFRHHLDRVHFMSIKDKDHALINCECIICGEISMSTQRHHKHLQNVHFSFDTKIAQHNEHIDIDNSELKSRIQQVSVNFISNYRRYQKQDGSHNECDYLGMNFDVIETKENDVLGLEQKYVISNLIWKQIFTNYPDTEYYALGETQGVKRGYLLIPKQY